jgi:hypothetical protein
MTPIPNCVYSVLQIGPSDATLDVLVNLFYRTAMYRDISPAKVSGFLLLQVLSFSDRRRYGQEELKAT